MNPGGAVPIVVGSLLLFLAVTGRYKQAVGILSGRPPA